MKAIKKIFDTIKPHVQEGGKFHAFRSLYDGFETFAFVPNETSRRGSVNIHDAIDSKRIMSFVVIALLPALIFGMYNVGYQHFHAAGQNAALWEMFLFGALAVLPKIAVSYIVGLGIEFTVAQWKGEEIHEGFLVSGIIIPLIIPVTTPLWILAIATAFAVIFAKEIFGGTGMNIFNVALITRAFLFFSYPSKMTGDLSVWIASKAETFGLFGAENLKADALSGATPLGMAANGTYQGDCCHIMDAITGLIPGSVGETSVIAIAIGAIILLWTGVASWKIMISVFAGGAATGALMQALGLTDITWWHHLVLGGFAFGAVFMATDPVTSARTECGKYIYGLAIGFIAVLVRVLNPGYPEGMMLAILLLNLFAPLIDYCFVQSNIKMRAKRATKNN